MLNLLIYLLTIGTTLYTATIYRGEAPVLLLMVEIVYLLVSLLLLLYQKSRLRFELMFPIPMFLKGQKIILNAALRHAGGLPVPKMKITLWYRVFGSRKRKKIKLFAMTDGQSALLESNLREEQTATCFFDKASIRIYDPLGMLYITKKVPLQVRLDIMPEVHPIHVAVSDQVHHFVGDSDIYDNFRPGDDASEIFRIREYRSGDSLRNIHWKLSAKKEEWLVRENSRQLSCAVILIWDFAKVGKRKQKLGLRAFLSLAFSVSFALMEQGCPHYAVWYGKKEEDILRMRIDDEESLSECFLAMMVEEPVMVQKDIRGIYHEKYKGENWLKEICINRGLELQIQGEKIAQFDEKTLDVELESLELIL